MSEGYNPKVLGLCCRWCSYAGADLAGAMRLQYPPAVKIMMVPCTGRVDILHILKAFEAPAGTRCLSPAVTKATATTWRATFRPGKGWPK